MLPNLFLAGLACANNPCLNGATCVEEGVFFKCICPDGFEGKECQFTLPGANANFNEEIFVVPVLFFERVHSRIFLFEFRK